MKECADALGDFWRSRTPVAVILHVDPSALRHPETTELPPWRLGPAFEFVRERLQYLVWSNNYDCRGDQPIWWHGRKAQRLADALAARQDSGVYASPGSNPTDRGDFALADGTVIWCDGGPREYLVLPNALVIHRDAIQARQLRPNTMSDPKTDLAPDQRLAVLHPNGPARVIAPAGSGKTRVLTERLRHVLADQSRVTSTVIAVAYNKRAADEMAARTQGLDAHIRTLNSLGLAIVNGTPPFEPGPPPRRVIEESEVRRILESLLDARHRANTDPFAPYIEALSAIRQGLRDPEEVEGAYPDAAGVAGLFERYRSTLAENRLVDFDEQIYGAIDTLLRNPNQRIRAQGLARHLLVDEFQDLTPAHVLLLRLLAAPTYEVFGVGDDDQVIYSYAGAKPEFLIDYDRYFPGSRHYTLTVNYRCPPTVIAGALALLGYNDRRIVKEVVSVARSGGALEIEQVSPEGHAVRALSLLKGWSSEGCDWSEMAILGRVNAALLASQVMLMTEGVPCSAPLTQAILGRTGTKTALAYLRIASDSDRIARADVAETIRRPSRRIARNVVEMIQKRPSTSLGAIRRLARSLSGADAQRVAGYGDDLTAVIEAAHHGGTPAALRTIRITVGLGGLMDILDASRGEVDRSTHADDLAALEQVASLNTDPATFETWLRSILSRPGHRGGVNLSTVHKVKGQEWANVIVVGASGDAFPHRLSNDVEEERRILHVAITRAGRTAVVLSSADNPSPFCAELTGAAPRDRRLLGRRDSTKPSLAPLAPTVPKKPALSSGASAVVHALKVWRLATASREGLPAFIVLSDETLEGIAAAAPASLIALSRCRGIGPAKLDRYGDEILSVIDANFASGQGSAG